MHLDASPLPALRRKTRGEMASVTDWLLCEGRELPDICSLLADLAPRLTDKGVPLLKMLIGVEQLHPELFAETYAWDREAGTSIIARPHGSERQESFTQGPIPLIFAGTPMIRVDLRSVGSDLEYAPGKWLRAEGGTEAVFIALPFSGRRSQVLSFVTGNPKGFSVGQIEKMVSILPVLGCVVELKATYGMAVHLLDAYVGHDAGTQILRGRVKRGAGTTVSGVIWFCDLAGFTAMSETLSRDELTSLLNQYFDAMAAPVEEHGGTVLKFIGDGMLAFFPLSSKTQERREVCASAASAARHACANIAGLNNKRNEEAKEPLAFGIALHIGEVMYGNIGAARRLDFTVIGPAVNYAARLEALSRTVGHSVIVSSEFAGMLPMKSSALGSYLLSGIEGEQEVYALPISMS